jgi:hypothetical protein
MDGDVLAGGGGGAAALDEIIDDEAAGGGDGRHGVSFQVVNSGSRRSPSGRDGAVAAAGG